MSTPWFRMYSEFSHDPKVQMLSEVMQRRYIMLMCLRCSNTLVTLHETELAFHLRISDADMAETKALFIKKGFIDKDFNLLNWEKRQFVSDTSKFRVAKFRALQKERQKGVSNGDVTLHEQSSNGLDTDTDTDTDKKEPSRSVVSIHKIPTCPTSSIVNLYHELLPEMPIVRLMPDGRKRAISAFWKFIFSSEKTDGSRRATTEIEALDWAGEYFKRARDNDFLMGRCGKSTGHENWRCDIDFLMTEKGRKHVIEKTKEAA